MAVKLLLIYLLAINFAGFALMGIDKKRAEAARWRIRERTLLSVAFIGGSVGSLLGMRLFRHKTKHLKFRLGIPCIILVQLAIIVLLFLNVRGII